jgi:hypothetical protein
MSLPTSVEPVKATLSTRSCAASGAPQAGERGLLGELEDDGAAAGERGGEFPHGHQQREIPGNDLRDHADGLAHRVGVEVVASRKRQRFAGDFRGPACHVAEHVYGQGHIRDASNAARLAVVEGFDLGELLEILFEQVGEFPDHAAAF